MVGGSRVRRSHGSARRALNFDDFGSGMAADEARWLLCCDGGWPALEAVEKIARSAAFIVGVDGGADRAIEHGLTVNHICGDLDSIAQVIGDEIHLEDQSESDLAKTLAWVASEGATRVDLIGVEGGAPDHALGAYAAVLSAPAELDITMHLATQRVHRIMPAQPFSEPIELETQFSIFALAGPATVTLTGARWTRSEEVLTLGTQGLHNVVEALPLTLESDAPLLLFIDH